MISFTLKSGGGVVDTQSNITTFTLNDLALAVLKLEEFKQELIKLSKTLNPEIKFEEEGTK